MCVVKFERSDWQTVAAANYDVPPGPSTFQPPKLARAGFLFGLWLRYRSSLQQYNEGFGQRGGNEETHRYLKMQTYGIKRGLLVTFYKKRTDISNPTIKEYLNKL